MISMDLTTRVMHLASITISNKNYNTNHKRTGVPIC